MLKDYCRNGHNTTWWGCTPSNACRACLKDKQLRRTYGISLAEYIAIYTLQGGKCAICRKAFGSYLPRQSGRNKARIEVDHDHHIKNKRESVRGLLCGGRWAGCNRKLGRIDNVTWLRNVITYLTLPPAQHVIRSKGEN